MAFQSFYELSSKLITGLISESNSKLAASKLGWLDKNGSHLLDVGVIVYYKRRVPTLVKVSQTHSHCLDNAQTTACVMISYVPQRHFETVFAPFEKQYPVSS